MKKRKISVMQIIRHACQLAAFIIYPGLFVSVFLAVKDIYTALISGKFAWSVQAPSVFLIIAVFLVTIIFGRFFCGFICSFGAMGDLMWFISSHTLKPRFRVSSQADRILKYLKYAVLLVIVLIGWTFAVFDFDGYSSPWTVFAMAASVKSWSQPTFLLTVGALLLLIIIAGSLLIERFFCRYLCPLGALFCLTSRIRLFRIRKPRRKCDKCSLCTYKCSMGIPLGETDIVKSGECIDCFACTDVCPKGNATANQAPIVTAAVAIAAMSGMIYVGNLYTDAMEQSAVQSASEAAAQAAQTVSGSTDASAAESSAENTAAAAESSTGTAESSAESAAASASASAGQYADGTYSGTGTGLRGTTEVSVTVSGGVITSVEIVSYEDDSQYFERAQGTIISEILESQSVDVSTVSGATFSSNGILEAVANALGIDFTNPNSSMQGGH